MLVLLEPSPLTAIGDDSVWCDKACDSCAKDCAEFMHHRGPHKCWDHT